MYFVLCLLNRRARKRWLFTTVEIQVMWMGYLLCQEQDQQNILYLRIPVLLNLGPLFTCLGT